MLCGRRDPRTHHRYLQPAGKYALLDAIGELIQHADRRIEARSRDNQPAEDQLVVIFSDGLENASRRYDRAAIAGLIRERQEAGWEFVFMAPTRTATSRRVAWESSQESISNFEPSAAGTSAAFQSISRATSEYRGKTRMERTRDSGTFFGGTREAEAVMRPGGVRAGFPKQPRGCPEPGAGGAWPAHHPPWDLALPCLPGW